MSGNTEEREGPEALFSTWMKAANDYWQTMYQVWSTAADTVKEGSAADQHTARNRSRASMDTAMKTFKAMSSAMAEPEAMSSLFKGAGAMPETLMRLALNSLGGFLQAQEKWFERAGRLGKSTEAYRFEDLDENAFRAWADIYETEFRQYLNIPQLGLTRFYQEKMNRAVDKYNILQTAMAEFSRLLFLPISRSLGVMQEKLGEMADAGELPEDAKSYYHMWIKIMEGHYMTLFQSPEYIKSLDNTLQTLCEFSAAKNDIVEDLINALPIPKQKEMDELYKEIYLMKKRLKTLEKQKKSTSN
jgi:hypothetical protein